ncbi:hypothetical protein CEP54_011504 [Fusarium duplospermum]|uniref:Lipoprotein n=1 Tax=Fusarium duplospermum TaxID=1325734 RepID=A0A428PEF6_9HYPO|nr:hypothetical protein CEP54_011504 [Fusarium duplospermum]
MEKATSLRINRILGSIAIFFIIIGCNDVKSHQPQQQKKHSYQDMTPQRIRWKGASSVQDDTFHYPRKDKKSALLLWLAIDTFIFILCPVISHRR